MMPDRLAVATPDKRERPTEEEEEGAVQSECGFTNFLSR